MAVPRVGIIGGGIAGVSLSRFLAEAGMTVTVFERGPQLCSGSTWHAAGLVTRFAGSPKLKKLHVQAIDLIEEVEAVVGRDIGYHRPGSIRLVEKGNRDRYLEAQQHAAMAKLYDHPDPELQTRMISNEEIRELHPLICTDTVDCGLLTPKDGYIDPTSLTTAVAEIAKAAGARITLATECTAVTRDRSTGAFHVSTRATGGGNEAEHEFDIFVNAAGLWSRDFSEKMMGMQFADHPCKVIQHQYVITETLPAIKERMERLGEAGVLPVIRDLRGSAYIRQERTGMLVGPYETDCHMAPWDAPPESFLFELFPPALDRLEDNLMCGFELIPDLAEAGIMNVTNGPTIWAGDGSPRVGPTSIPGYYDFNTLTYGITHGLPLAQYLAHVIQTGEQPKGMDLSEMEPARYQDWTTPEFVQAKIEETYSLNNAVNYGSFENRKAGRDLMPKDGLYNRLASEGARFGVGMGGVEHPLYFAGPEIEINPAKFTHHDWEPIVKAEAQHIVDKVSLGHVVFSVFKVEGPGAEDLLEGLTTANLPADTHKSKLMYMTNASGLVVSEVTVCKLGDDDYYVVGGRDNLPIDLRIMQDGVEGNPLVRSISKQTDILHLAGPTAQKVLAALNPAAGAIPFLGMAEVEIGGVLCSVFRITFTGCMGYEIHVPKQEALVVYDAIAALDDEYDIGRMGSYAINSLRIEKAFALKADLDFAHYKEAGINFFVSKTKDFKGKDTEGAYTPERRRVSMVVETAEGFGWSVPGDSPVYRRDTDELVGFTTTSALGGITGKTIAMGYLIGGGLANAKALIARDDLYVTAYGEEWGLKAQLGPVLPMTGRE